mmetsp:Transcript_1344/g.1798  ORF Transcript_1344/g.1798 Transcript_1344/m.1798 type:complete len:85 (-) Transcript_1344:195-449(-)
MHGPTILFASLADIHATPWWKPDLAPMTFTKVQSTQLGDTVLSIVPERPYMKKRRSKYLPIAMVVSQFFFCWFIMGDSMAETVH